MVKNVALKRLQYSGFDKEFRYDVVNAANNAYKKIKQKVEKGERKLHRPKDWKRTERKLERRTQKRITGIRKEIAKHGIVKIEENVSKRDKKEQL